MKCNICNFEGHFLDTKWHKSITCPSCKSSIRHRLFLASLEFIQDLNFDLLVNNKKVLHFSPEKSVENNLKNYTKDYVTANYNATTGTDMRLDISNMSNIGDDSFDLIIAFDVLEHVNDDFKACEELYRITKPQGFVVITVPQQDNLKITRENKTIVDSFERELLYGQSDHVRMYGDDIIERLKLFQVTIISEHSFSSEVVSEFSLRPQELSTEPLATNYRKIYFCKKSI